MTTTNKKKINRTNKKRYSTDKTYRDKVIKKASEESSKKEKQNPKEWAKYQREYYSENSDYRTYKKNYAKKYRKAEPIKSLAYKDRPKKTSKKK